MQIKRFEARDMQEALRQVKEILGPDAIILSTKSGRRAGNGPRGAKIPTVEVVAATDAPIPEPLDPGSPAMRGGSRASVATLEDPFLRRILSLGLLPEFAGKLAEEIKALCPRDRGEENLKTGLNYLRWKLMESVEIMPELQGPRVWAFVGPTGVGKTTTLAKVAAHFSLRFKKRMILITLDTYRIGAIEQLKTYARILGLPLEIVTGPEELGEIIRKYQELDLLLIDTAGRNPYQPSQMEELKNFLTVDPRIENHLVLSATTKDFDLDQIVRRFSVLPIQSYIFTKIDETEEYISLFNQLLRCRRPLSFLTNGQRVPEDIEMATKGRVAGLVLNRISWN